MNKMKTIEISQIKNIHNFRNAVIYKIISKGEEEALAFIKYIMQKNYNSEKFEKFARIILELGVMHSLPSFVKYAIEDCGIDVKDTKKSPTRGEHPLFHAIRKNDPKIVKLLIEYGSNVNIFSLTGTTPLHILAEQGNLQLMQFLFEISSPNINIQDKYGYTPLHTAIQQKNIQIVKFLISKGADIEAKNYKGFTPLHTAVWFNAEEIVFILIEAGANINATTNDGLTALNFAIKNRNEKLITLLRLKGAT